MGAGAGVLLAVLTTSNTGAMTQRIDWDPAEGCPSQAAVVQATREHLGHALAEYPRALIARARVEPHPAGYVLRLDIEIDGAREHHELVATDCDQVGRDAALLIASAVDPLARGPRAPSQRKLLVTPVVVQVPRSRSRPEPVTAVSPTPVTEASPTPPTPPPDARPLAIDAADLPEPGVPRSPRRPTGTLAVAGTGFVGLFPSISGGVILEGGLERGSFRWQAGAAGFFGGEFRAANDVGADLWAVSGSTGFCVAFGLRQIHLAGCAVAGVGAITATSANTQTTRTVARPWAYVGPDLRVTWTPRPRLGLYLGVSVLPALVRPGWSVSNPDVSFRIPPVAGLLRLGVELRRLGER